MLFASIVLFFSFVFYIINFYFLFLFLCMLQVSTGTGIMSHFVNLHIVIPEAFILGNAEHHLDPGSTINLVCIIEKVSRPLYSALAQKVLGSNFLDLDMFRSVKT